MLQYVFEFQNGTDNLCAYRFPLAITVGYTNYTEIYR